MKCNAWVLRGKGNRKSKWIARWYKPGDALVETTRKEAAAYLRVPVSGVGECGGEIKAAVTAGLTPYCYPCSPQIEVEYKCQRCGCTHYMQLPDEHTLSQWLTEWIAQYRPVKGGEAA